MKLGIMIMNYTLSTNSERAAVADLEIIMHSAQIRQAIPDCSMPCIKIKQQ